MHSCPSCHTALLLTCCPLHVRGTGSRSEQCVSLDARGKLSSASCAGKLGKEAVLLVLDGLVAQGEGAAAGLPTVQAACDGAAQQAHAVLALACKAAGSPLAALLLRRRRRRLP
jgi:hypothetical protein